ncbi:putative HTH-type transcriptional regulator YybR [Roseibium album]|nr:putative HTH-type transcriptional regulator YybR [Roseibium album]
MRKTGYGQTGCPVVRTLNVIGERWTVLMLRDLLLKGAMKYQDFQESLESISPNTLSARLKFLTEQGIVERRVYEDHPIRVEYVLTRHGRSLGPILAAMRDWGNTHTSQPESE